MRKQTPARSRLASKHAAELAGEVASKNANGADRGEQADHPELVIRRSAKLRILEPVVLPADWEMKSGVPATRAECKSGQRPCPYLSCVEHLWLRLQEEQPGNPQKGSQGKTTFRPSTMETCALDVADAGGATFTEIGAMLGMDVTRARQIANGALEKLKQLGLDVDDLIEAIA